MLAAGRGLGWGCRPRSPHAASSRGSGCSRERLGSQTLGDPASDRPRGPPWRGPLHQRLLRESRAGRHPGPSPFVPPAGSSSPPHGESVCHREAQSSTGEPPGAHGPRWSPAADGEGTSPGSTTPGHPGPSQGPPSLMPQLRAVGGQVSRPLPPLSAELSVTAGGWE